MPQVHEVIKCSCGGQGVFLGGVSMLTTSVKMVGTLLPKLSSSISRLPLSTMFFAGVVEDSGVPLERFDVQNTYYGNMGHF